MLHSEWIREFKGHSLHCVTIFFCYSYLICSFRPPASSSDPSTDPGLFLLLTLSPLLQTGHHFLLFLLLQSRCLLGRWPTGSPGPLKPPRCNFDNRNLWDQGVRDRWRRATAEEERQRREQGEREKGGGWGTGERRMCNAMHGKTYICDHFSKFRKLSLVKVHVVGTHRNVDTENRNIKGGRKRD